MTNRKQLRSENNEHIDTFHCSNSIGDKNSAELGERIKGLQYKL